MTSFLTILFKTSNQALPNARTNGNRSASDRGPHSFPNTSSGRHPPLRGFIRICPTNALTTSISIHLVSQPGHFTSPPYAGGVSVASTSRKPQSVHRGHQQRHKISSNRAITPYRPIHSPILGPPKSTAFKEPFHSPHLPRDKLPGQLIGLTVRM